MMSKQVVSVIGATSMVGRLVLQKLAQQHYSVVAYSRSPQSQLPTKGVVWRNLNELRTAERQEGDRYWLCLCPIWMLEPYFDQLLVPSTRRIVAMSSTSRFTKMAESRASSFEDNLLASRLAKAEEILQACAQLQCIEWVILRPTMIYDFKSDKNLRNIAEFIGRYHFFPILGSGMGRRQPVHAIEVADAVLAAMVSGKACNKAYQISGGEILTYRYMVERIFIHLNLRPVIVRMPISIFKMSIILARILPKYRYLSSSMALRMGEDLVFDNEQARTDFGYDPAPFLAHCDRDL